MTGAPVDDASLGGGCLCGAVRFTVPHRPPGVSTCHCGQCRRFHGHVGAYIVVPGDSVAITAGDSLAWYHSSAVGRRGFCRTCGSSLFWRGEGSGELEIAAGCLDQPTGLRTLSHTFVASKGDYYEITDDLPQYPANGPGETPPA
ncbi:GFA family protein [Azospirillum thermophilum]|uniref:Aldehyde-activating protein n=1 Tax=Azospirillum thermophilum TaxID=2202148 RepID=A0A2S2CS01_9PROT|nr:GFA family protein [Azospirillum thermophilum]AWK87249.1 aldehyde-activating protein [Azospirillum thermophilum]